MPIWLQLTENELVHYFGSSSRADLPARGKPLGRTSFCRNIGRTEVSIISVVFKPIRARKSVLKEAYPISVSNCIMRQHEQKSHHLVVHHSVSRGLWTEIHWCRRSVNKWFLSSRLRSKFVKTHCWWFLRKINQIPRFPTENPGTSATRCIIWKLIIQRLGKCVQWPNGYHLCGVAFKMICWLHIHSHPIPLYSSVKGSVNTWRNFFFNNYATQSYSTMKAAVSVSLFDRKLTHKSIIQSWNTHVKNQSGSLACVNRTTSDVPCCGLTWGYTKADV